MIVGCLAVVLVLAVGGYLVDSRLTPPSAAPPPAASSSQPDPPSGFLPDLTIVPNSTQVVVGPGSYQAYNVVLGDDADIFGSFAASVPTTGCLVNETVAAIFGNGAAAYGTITSLTNFTTADCEWSTGTTTNSGYFDAYVIGGATTFVLFNDNPTYAASVLVTSDIYATFDEY